MKKKKNKFKVKNLKKVMIATPSHDGKVEALYMHSLISTILCGYRLGYDIIPITICNDALIQKARNDLFALAYNAKVDELVFIDADNSWNPDDFFKLLKHDVDIVSGTCRKKNDQQELYNVRIKDGEKKLYLNEDGLIEVKGAGFAFFRISGKVLNKIWDAGQEYNEIDQIKKDLFKTSIDPNNNTFVSEDISFCILCKKIGLQTYIDPTITVNHIGSKSFLGNFEGWCESVKIVKRIDKQVENHGT